MHVLYITDTEYDSYVKPVQISIHCRQFRGAQVMINLMPYAGACVGYGVKRAGVLVASPELAGSTHSSIRMPGTIVLRYVATVLCRENGDGAKSALIFTWHYHILSMSTRNILYWSRPTVLSFQ